MDFDRTLTTDPTITTITHLPTHLPTHTHTHTHTYNHQTRHHPSHSPPPASPTHLSHLPSPPLSQTHHHHLSHPTRLTSLSALSNIQRIQYHQSNHLTSLPLTHLLTDPSRLNLFTYPLDPKSLSHRSLVPITTTSQTNSTLMSIPYQHPLFPLHPHLAPSLTIFSLSSWTLIMSLDRAIKSISHLYNSFEDGEVGNGWG